MNRIRYVEYDAKHTEDFIFDIPEGHDCYLLVFTHTPAVFLTSQGLQEYSANCAVLFAPGTPIYYKASGGVYENDWCRFDSNEEYVTAFPIQGVPFFLPDTEYLHSLFQLLTWKTAFPGENTERTTNQLFSLIFSELKEAAALSCPALAASPHYQELLILRKAIYNTPQSTWNVPEMAKKLHLSEGYLQAIYKKAFSISCMDDCIRARIRLAKDQLSYTNKSIAEIAEYCGYRNLEHFSRQFKQYTGQSPLDFRKKK